MTPLTPTPLDSGFRRNDARESGGGEGSRARWGRFPPAGGTGGSRTAPTVFGCARVQVVAGASDCKFSILAGAHVAYG